MHTLNTCGTSALWPELPSSTTCRSFVIFLRIVSVLDLFDSHTSMQAMSCDLYSASPAIASETRKATDHCVAFFPAVRALSRKGEAGFSRCRAHCRELVDVIDPSRDWGGPGPSAARQHRPAYRDRPSQLRDSAPARTARVAFRRSGFS